MVFSQTGAFNCSTLPSHLCSCLADFLIKKLIIEKTDSKCTYLRYQNRADVLWIVVLSSSVIA